MWHLKHADVTLTLLKRQSLVSGELSPHIKHHLWPHHFYVSAPIGIILHQICQTNPQLMKKILPVTCCIMLSGFKPLDSKLLRQIREQTKFKGRLNPDYTASVVGETNQVNFKVCIVITICRGVLEFVLVLLMVKVLAPNKI